VINCDGRKHLFKNFLVIENWSLKIKDMASRSLNKVQLIGNLTRDPELRYTPQGTAVCTIGLATNRYWTTDSGEKREDTEFHRLVAWNKLAELCAQLLTKGRKIYVEGRLQTRSWTGQDGNQRTTTEIVIDDMILLDSRRSVVAPAVEEVTAVTPAPVTAPAAESVVPEVGGVVSVTRAPSDTGKKKKKKAEETKEGGEEAAVPEERTAEELKEEVSADDIPF